MAEYQYLGTRVPESDVKFHSKTNKPMALIANRWQYLTEIPNGAPKPEQKHLTAVKEQPVPAPVAEPEPEAEPEKIAAKRTSYTASELMETEFPEVRYAVPGLVAEGLNLFVGAPKMGKSWGALNLAIAVAQGGFAFGKVPVDKGEVLYLALEDPPRRLKSRLHMLLGQLPAPQGLHFETEWDYIGQGGEERLEEWLTEHPDCRLVVVDVLMKLRAKSSGKGSLYGEDYDAITPFKKLADQFNCAFLLIHHTRKAAAEDFIDAVSGTQGLAGAADAVLYLKRGRGQATGELHVTGRDVVEKSYALQFDGTIGCWSLMGDAAEYSLNETQQQIVNLLKIHGSLTPAQVPKLSEIKYEAGKKALQRMAEEGKVLADKGTYILCPRVPAVPANTNPQVDATFNGDNGGDKGSNGFVPLSPLDPSEGQRDNGDSYETWRS